MGRYCENAPWKVTVFNNYGLRYFVIFESYFGGFRLLTKVRTDNSIKNHFYSTIRRSLRRINKELGDKNSTAQIKDIKPGVLSKIFLLSNQDPNKAKDENQKNMILISKSLESCLVSYANYKPNKKNKQ